MRKVLLAVLALGGAMGAAQQAHAGPAVGSAPALDQPAQVQSVQYYDDWRYRQYRRREAFEYRQRLREQRRFERGYYGPRHGYGPGYGYGPPPGFRQFGGYYGPRY